jgi:hypothetical protein
MHPFSPSPFAPLKGGNKEARMRRMMMQERRQYCSSSSSISFSSRDQSSVCVRARAPASRVPFPAGIVELALEQCRIDRSEKMRILLVHCMCVYFDRRAHTFFRREGRNGSHSRRARVLMIRSSKLEDGRRRNDCKCMHPVYRVIFIAVATVTHAP